MSRYGSRVAGARVIHRDASAVIYNNVPRPQSLPRIRGVGERKLLMRQLARRLKDGNLELVEVRDPSPGPGAVAVSVEASVLSAGTERATLDLARSSLIAKARRRPDQARQIIERMRREGVRSTLELVRQRLEELGPLGYSAAGVVVEAGREVRGISPGDRVSIAGGGFANHSSAMSCPPFFARRCRTASRRRRAPSPPLGRSR